VVKGVAGLKEIGLFADRRFKRCPQRGADPRQGSPVTQAGLWRPIAVNVTRRSATISIVHLI